MQRLLWLGLAAFTLLQPTLGASQSATPLKALSTVDDGRGWEAVGRLNLGGVGFCTGALIAPDLVLTAAHCMFNKQTEAPFAESELEFLAGWRNGRAEAYRGISQIVVHPDYRLNESDRISRVSNDLALVKLDRPIRSVRVEPFETARQPRRGSAVGVVSYARERAEAPSLQETCHVMERYGGVVMLTCEVNFGSSGAPVFVVKDGVARIVSVVSAKASVDGDRVALSSEVSGKIDVLMELLGENSGALRRGAPKVSNFTAGNRRGDLGAKFVKP